MRRWMLSLFASLVVLLAWVLPACAPEAKQAEAAEFYKSNPVLAITTVKAGGGTDIFARIFAEGWNKVIGGNMVVENDPSGGNLAAVKRAVTIKPDGLTIGISDASDAINAVLTQAVGVQHKLEQIAWIGFSQSPRRQFAISVNLPYNSMAEVQKHKNFRLGVSGTVGASFLLGALVTEVFNLNLLGGKLVTAIESIAEMGLAAKRGDLDGYIQNGDNIKDAINKGYLKMPPLFSPDKARDMGYFPDVPTILEIAKLTKEQQEFLDIILALKQGKVVYFPKDVPADKLKFMQDSFTKVMSDEAVQKRMLVQWPVLPPFMDGKAFAEGMKAAMVVKPEDIGRVQSMAKKYAP